MWLESLRRFAGLNSRDSRTRGRAQRRRTSRPFTAALCLETLEGRLTPSALTVTNLLDSTQFTAGDGSLRGEIAAAQNGDTIQFSQNLAGQMIALSAGQLEVSQSVSIVGPTGGLTVSGNGASRVFQIDGGVAVALSGLTVTGGNAAAGGGVYNGGALTLTSCNVSANTGTYGGGIDNAGSLTVIDCTLAANSAAQGGAIYDDPFGASADAVTLINSTVADNSSLAYGEGIESWAALRLTNCTVTANHAGNVGGGIFGVTTIGGTVSLANTIVDGNLGGSGTGVSNDVYDTAFIANYCLIGKDDVAASTGVSSISGSHNQVNVNNPGLALLGSYGGPTQTVALLPGSPAIDAGSNALAVDANGNPLGSDQRGLPFQRVVGSAVDVGAFEFQNIVVSTTGDENDGNYGPVHLSLIEAVELADTMPSGATITFDPTVFATQQSITLNSQLDLSGAVSIQGPAAGITVSGQGGTRVCQVDRGANATLSQITIENGEADSQAGGGVLNAGTLTLTGCALIGNDAAQGGAIENSGALTLNYCTLTGNTSSTIFGTPGGGAVVNEGGVLSLTGCTLADNTAHKDGGGIENAGGTAVVTGSTFVANAALDGGAVDNAGGSLAVINSTLYSNSVTVSGGAVDNESGTLTLTNDTITANRSTFLGIGGGVSVSGGSAALANTIVTGNFDISPSQPDDVSGAVTANYCLIGNAAGASLAGANNLLNANPVLGSFGNYGGPTQTIPLLPGSAAIDAGSIALAVDASGNPLASDQRGGGFLRVFGAAVDIGAYEVGRHFVVVTTSDNPAPGLLSLHEAVQWADNNPDVGPETITFDPAVFGTAQTVALTQGAIEVTGPLTVSAPAAGVTISGNGTSGILQVDAGAVVVLNGLNLVDGNAAGNGGAIDSGGTLTLNACGIYSNFASGNGGGAYNTGTLTIVNSVFGGSQSGANVCGGDGGGLDNVGGTVAASGTQFDYNFAGNSGAGIANEGGGTLTLTNCDVSQDFGNYAGPASDGGGLYNSAGSTATLTNCVFHFDVNYYGGAIFNAGALTVSGGSLSDDRTVSGYGEGIDNSGTLVVTGITSDGGIAVETGGNATLLDSLVTGNAPYSTVDFEVNGGNLALANCTIAKAQYGVTAGGGVVSLTNCTIAQCGNGVANTGASVTLANTLVGDNAADVSGAVTANYSLIDDTAGVTLLPGSGNNVLNENPQILNGLYPNGGPFDTIALLPGSPAIDAGSTALALDPSGNPLTTDMRGAPFVRVFGGSVDIGAFEFQNFNLVVSTTGDENDGNYSYGHLSLREALALVHENNAGFDNTITFDPTVFATPQTIALTGGGLALDADVTITGPAAGVTISGQGTIFVVGRPDVTYGPQQATLSDLTITGGSVLVEGQNDLALTGCTFTGGSSTGYGGALNIASGTVTATNCTFVGNSASDGGAVYNSAALTLTDCGFLNNTATSNAVLNGLVGGGGAVFNVGTLVANGCLFDGNSTTISDGGAVLTIGPANLTDCTFVANTAEDGGAVDATVSSPHLPAAELQPVPVSLTDCTLSDNEALGLGAAVNAAVDVVTLNGCSFSNNSDKGVGGGAVAASGLTGVLAQVNLNDCLLTNNTAPFGDGGAIFDAANLTVTDCELTSNSCGLDGGAVDDYQGTLTVSGCTLTGNTAGYGGAIANAGFQSFYFGGVATVANSTLSGNTASVDGGGLTGAGVSTLVTNCTITANHAASGGGVSFANNGTGDTLTLNNTIDAGNFQGNGTATADDVGGDPFTANYSLIGTTTGGTVSGTGDVLNVNALLGPLANNGGPAETCALLPGSPALNAGSNALAVVANGDPLVTDQRGLARVVEPAVDIGAFEVQQSATDTSLSADATNNSAVFGQVVTYTATVSPAGGGSATGTVSLYEDDQNVANETLGTNDQAVFTVTGLHAGNHDIRVVYSGDGTVFGSTADSILQVTPATPTVVVQPAGATFDGNAHGTTAEAFGVNGVDLGPAVVTYSTTDGSVPVHAGRYTATGSFAGNQDYAAATGTGAITIGQATPTVVVQPVTVPYDGLPHGTTAEVFGVNDADLGPAAVTYSTSNGLTPVQAGSYTATGTYAGSQDYIGATGTAAVDILQATHFVIPGLPSSVTAGAPISLTIRAEDAAGDVVPGFLGAVRLGSSDARAVLPVNVSLTGGTATFQVKFETAGRQSLTVADPNKVLPTATATAAVNPAAAARLVFSGQPINALYWDPLGPVCVELVDAFGNKVDSSAPVTVALANNPGNGQLDGALTANTVHGAATFSDLTVSEVGNGYTLTAMSPGLGAATSLPFTVTGLAAGLTRQGDVLYIVGGPGFNSVQVKPAGSAPGGSTGVSVRATLNGRSFSQTFGAGLSVIRVYVHGNGSSVQLAPGLTLNAYVSAGAGSNSIQGDNGNDVILTCGSGTIVAGNGNDIIRSGNGYNVVEVGGGNDVISVGNGGSAIFGGNGNDTVLAGNGYNFVMLGNGNDVVATGTGGGAVFLGKGKDVVAEAAPGIVVHAQGTERTESAPPASVLLGVLDSWFASSSNVDNLRNDLSVWLGPLG